MKDKLINKASRLCSTTGNYHAVIKLANGRRKIVAGYYPDAIYKAARDFNFKVVWSAILIAR